MNSCIEFTPKEENPFLELQLQRRGLLFSAYSPCSASVSYTHLDVYKRQGCSRTDAGVHALGFMLYFHADTRIPAAKLPLALNQHLPPDIRVLEAVISSLRKYFLLTK